MIRLPGGKNRSRAGLAVTAALLVTIALIFWICVSPALAAAAGKPKGGDNAWADDTDLFGGGLNRATPAVADPLEPVNRVVFQFNDKLYFWVLKPIAKGYRFVIPEPARLGVHNFFYNLLTPVRLVNCLLQGKIKAGGAELGAFIVNTTGGVLGNWRPSEREPSFKGSDEDLGQTLAKWGVGNGFYLVLPLLGPSTLRDAVGTAGDGFLDPVYYVNPTEDAVAISAFRTVNHTSLHIGDYEAIKNAAIDPYAAFRDGYLQYRAEKIRE